MGVGDSFPDDCVLGLMSIRGIVIDIGVEVAVVVGLCGLTSFATLPGIVESEFPLPSAAPAKAQNRTTTSIVPHTILNFILRVLARYHSQGAGRFSDCSGSSRGG